MKKYVPYSGYNIFGFDVFLKTEYFTICLKEDDIFIVKTTQKELLSLGKSNIVYHCKKSKDLILYTLRRKRNLPDIVRTCISFLTRSLLGETIELYGDEENPSRHKYSSTADFAKYYAIKTPVRVKLTVIGQYDTPEAFEASVLDSDDKYSIAYGIWTPEKNVIPSSFIWSAPLLVQMCFPDGGENSLRKGAKFVKLKVSKV